MPATTDQTTLDPARGGVVTFTVNSFELSNLVKKVDALGECETAETVDYIAAALSAGLDTLTGQHSCAINAMLGADAAFGGLGDAAALEAPIADVAWPAVKILEKLDELVCDTQGRRGETGVSAIRHTTLVALRDAADALHANLAALNSEIDAALHPDNEATR